MKCFCCCAKHISPSILTGGTHAEEMPRRVNSACHRDWGWSCAVRSGQLWAGGRSAVTLTASPWDWRRWRRWTSDTAVIQDGCRQGWIAVDRWVVEVLHGLLIISHPSLWPNKVYLSPTFLCVSIEIHSWTKWWTQTPLSVLMFCWRLIWICMASYLRLHLSHLYALAVTRRCTGAIWVMDFLLCKASSCSVDASL